MAGRQINLVDGRGSRLLGASLDLLEARFSRSWDPSALGMGADVALPRPASTRGGRVFHGRKASPEVLVRYARWSRRRLSPYRSEDVIRTLVRRTGTVLVVAPLGDGVWERVLSDLHEVPLDATTISFVPYTSEEELAALLLRGAVDAAVHDVAGRPPLLPPLHVDPLAADGGDPSFALTGHSRPYCALISREGRNDGLCTSRQGTQGLCYGGHRCALSNGTPTPIDDIRAVTVLLNGCSTALPPVDALPFSWDHLLGYRLFKGGPSLVLGNVGLGPAADWELAHQHSLALRGIDCATAMSAINRLRQAMGCHTSFRLVAYGDPALFSATMRGNGATVRRRARTIEVVWRDARAVQWAQVDVESLIADPDAALVADVAGSATDEPAVYCFDDPLGEGRLLVVTRRGEALSPELRVVLRAEVSPSAVRGRQLEEAARGACALMTVSTDWQLQQALADATQALRSREQALRTFHVAPPDSARLVDLERSIGGTTRATCHLVLQRYLHLLREHRLSLGDLYGVGIAQDSARTVATSCPVCGLPAWRKTRRIPGVAGVAVTQLQCPLCAIVSDGPSWLHVEDVSLRRVRGGTPGFALELRLRNTAPFPAECLYVWHAETEPAARDMKYDDLAAHPSSLTLPPDGSAALTYTSPAAFQRVVHLYFVANGHVGFVQVKDAEVARDRRRSKTRCSGVRGISLVELNRPGPRD